jgi:large subunit ribosomal protein L15
MIKLNALVAPSGARKKPKRVGRGCGSGRGTTAGKGTKGQKARAGRKPRLGFEGGQMPLQRRIPKRGFRSINRREYAIVNVERLAKFEPNTVITPEVLLEKRIISDIKCGVKILGKGEINIPLEINVDAISKNAAQKIEAAGGKVITNYTGK